MTLAALDWSAPAATGHAWIKAEDGDSTWRIVPVPGDVVRIGFDGKDEDGTVVDCRHDFAYAESVDEAKLLIDLMRTGADALPDWRTQLEAAGFVRTYPEAEPDDVLSCLWNDGRRHGLFQIVVKDGYVHPGRSGSSIETSVTSSYETERATSHNNVSGLFAVDDAKKQYGELCIRHGVPAGVDVLRTGVAAALAIRAARIDRGGRFVNAIGGAPKRPNTKRERVDLD